MTSLDPIGPNAVHLCIDMQRLFAETTDWHTPALPDIIPNIVRIARAHPVQNIFARVTVPTAVNAARGSWVEYYRRWNGIVAAVAKDAGLIEIVEPLVEIARCEETLDKPAYSMFASALHERLAAREVDTLIFTGVETDICVLSTIFAAIDLGYKTIVVDDAVTSSDIAAHRAVLDIVLPRMPQQVSIVDTETLMQRWSS